MLRKLRLFTPGPTPLLPAAARAMAAADVHHRTADFRALYAKTLLALQTFIGTKHDVLMLAASGSGAMEASVSNLTSPGDKVLVLSAGKFGERWRDIAKAFGCAVEMVNAPYGETWKMADVGAKLGGAGGKDIRCVYLQATESSTGVRHDVEAVAKVLRETGSDALLVVDAITGLGTTRLDVDAWGIDVVIGGSQKAVMVPPGLAYLAVSERAWQRAAAAKSPRYYFDLARERKAAAKGESAFTPATALIAGLAAALDYIREAGNGDLAAGRNALIANAETAAAMTRAAAEALGLKLYAKQSPAPALTAIAPPEGMDSGVIVKAFRDEFAAVVANGQGEMKGQMFRIAHLGYYDYLDTIAIIGALEHVLAKVGAPRHIEFGAGLRAAQEAYAKAAPRLLGAAR
ncbi:MAG: alanine--glyoxylate aminotransferase family protein [Candidatus Koribacter versatilis]|uniref:Alanine--glyoxylate aminotransferase family protein n=1 Tax=Candidatus Korobacter versatilis TaxID=658062 RepID=A0A932A7R2_9BACT|nr:alanine--glyoxylate aminotransferase family protein [Candidatus Koribacter versatilis]